MAKQKLGIALNCDTVGYTVELAKRAEAAGFDTAWTWDTPTHNAYVALAAIALGTSTIKLGPGVGVAWGRSPTIHATAARDIDELANGRFILGLGSGTKRQIDYWYSILVEHPAPRIRELVQVLRMLFASHKGAKIDYEGRFYHLKLERYYRAGVKREQIPIHLAAVQPRMLEIVGEVADGLVGHPIYTVQYINDVVVPSLQKGLAKSGRQRSDLELNSYIICSIHKDSKQAWREVTLQVAHYCATRSYAIMMDHHGWGDVKEPLYAAFRAHDWDGMVKAIPEEMARAMAVAGTPDEVREQMKRYEGVLDVPILYAPGQGSEHGRREEILASMIETFAQ